MIARLYSNENFPLPVVAALRVSGHDALTSLDAGKANDAIPDDEVLRYATAARAKPRVVAEEKPCSVAL